MYRFSPLIAILLLASAALALTGCFGGPAPSQSTLHDDELTGKLYAIRRAGEQRDASAVPDLVELLDHDDPAVRMMSIQSLERITGERHGYEPFTSPTEREPAIARWEQAVELRSSIKSAKATHHKPQTSTAPAATH